MTTTSTPDLPEAPRAPAAAGESLGPTGRRPRRLGLVVGVLLVLVGGVLAVRPFSSLAVLVVLVVTGLGLSAVGELLTRDDPSRGPWRRARAAAQLLAAVAVLVWPGPTIRVLAVAVGAALLVGGVLEVVAGLRGRGLARWNALVSGTAYVLLGGLALSWPDVTVIVVAVLFGARVLVLGARLVVDALRGTEGARRERPGGRRVGWWRLSGSVAGALVAVALVVLGIALERGVPRPDAFYDPPDSVPAQPGALLRVEPFTRGIPPGAEAWRILYTTTWSDGRPALASALVVAPRGASAPTPVVAWAHGTTGASPGCAPSVLDDTLETGGLFVTDRVVEAGWTLVATDYAGLGTAGTHEYLVGQGEARSVLDSVRAARRMTQVRLAGQTVVWGHSQGGHAALWTGIAAPAYAPDVPIAGVAGLAPASNLPGLVQNLGNVTGGAIFASYVVQAYTTTYPDVDFDAFVRPGARIITREMAQRCLAEPGILVSALTAVALDKPIWQGSPDRGAFHDRLVENVPTGAVPAPVLVAQGGADSLVTPAAQDAFVASRCAAGHASDYRTYAGRDHLSLVEADSPAVTDLFAWTADRFAGRPAGDTCR